jgi:hypothetical protein
MQEISAQLLPYSPKPAPHLRGFFISESAMAENTKIE